MPVAQIRRYHEQHMSFRYPHIHQKDETEYSN